MMIDVFFFIVGFGIVCVLTGAFREIICFGSFAGIKILQLNIPAFEAPFGGFILVGIMAGTFRAIYNYAKHSIITHFRKKSGSDPERSKIAKSLYINVLQELKFSLYRIFSD